ncbi:phage tail tape measure protein [Pararhizobium mangrovi]|uniref:Phage tail tape measure protein n=1 Tax=Pararhizobium mangrovi TaxID=2590452 RepID=A0A506TXK5_9HYPH|nr:phage tail tape measure protein [Pararhizobium mangrovi]TPW26046.1 phage tail tape measure protein [Pararhizobium mangrovi]
MDVAYLGMGVDSSQVKGATGELGRLSGAAEKAESRARRFGGAATKAGREASAANDNAARSARKMAGAYDLVWTSVKRAAGQFLAFTAASVGIGSTIRTLASFEQSMSQVAAITRATGADLKAMRDVAKDLGATTEFSAAQAADGLKYLGMAGFDAQKSIAAIPSVLDLATAASMGLAQSADITSNIMSAFGIAANKASSVADILAAASSRANTDVGQLGDAMKYVGPVASSFGVSMSDAAAAVGVLSNNGLQGSMAGTGLRRVISSLANPTNAAVKALNAMGVAVESVNPKTHSLVDIVGRLAKAGLSGANALEIFGDRGGPAILALTRNAPQLRELTGQLSNVEGTAKRMADTMRDNLMGDLHNLASSAQSVVIAMGDNGMTGVFRGVAQVGVVGLRFLADNMNTVARATTVAGAALLVAFGPAALSAIATGFGYMVGGMLAGLTALRVAIMTNPLGVLATAIAIVLAAAYTFRDEFEEIFGVSIVDAVKIGGNKIIGAFVGAYSAVISVWQRLPDALSGIAKQAANSVLKTLNQPWLSVNGHTIIPGLGGAGELKLSDAEKSAVNGAVGAFKSGYGRDYLGVGGAVEPGTGRRASPGSRSNTSADAAAIKKIQDAADALGNDGGAGTELPTISTGGAGSAADTAARKAERAAKAYDRLTQSAESFVASQETERATVGMSEMAAAKYSHTQKLLNQAKQQGIKLSASQKAELQSLGAEMGEQEVATKRLKDAYSSVKDGVKGVFSSFRGAIEQGKSIWKAFGDAAQSVLDKIIGKIEDQLSTSITNALFSAKGSGSSGGGLFGSIFSGVGHLFGFANGTNYAPGGPALVGERGPEIVNLPRGSQVVPNHHLRAAANNNAQPQAVDVRSHVSVSVDDDGKIQTYVTKSEARASAKGAQNAVNHVKSNWGNYQGQQQMHGQVR